MKTLCSEDIFLSTPMRLFCCGPSGCGKTTFLKNFIKHYYEITDKKLRNIVYCYASYQKIYDEIKQSNENVIFVEGFPCYIEDSYLSDPDEHDLLIIDDLIDKVADQPLFRDIFLRNSHHKNYSVIVVTQNPFYKSKFLRTCSLQCTGFVIFKCSRDQSMISNLARQILPNNQSFLMDVYQQITEEPFKYMFVDFSPHCIKELRIRGNIIPEQLLDIYLS